MAPTGALRPPRHRHRRRAATHLDITDAPRSPTDSAVSSTSTGTASHAASAGRPDTQHPPHTGTRPGTRPGTGTDPHTDAGTTTDAGPTTHGAWLLTQRLIDPDGDGEWRFVARIDLDEALAEGAPTLRLESLGPYPT